MCGKIECCAKAAGEILFDRVRKQSSCGLGWVKSESSPTVTHYTFVILCIIVNNNSACMFLWFLSSLLLLLLFLMPQKQTVLM